MSKSEIRISALVPKRYHPLLDSIMPGGNVWDAEGSCLETCPYYSRCKHSGPRRLCSSNWKTAPLEANTAGVFAHVVASFPHYNCDDYEHLELADQLDELTQISKALLEGIASRPTDVKTLVKVRLRQMEFKRDLYALWQGCSLENVFVDDCYLVASHIVPWAISNSTDRVSRYNGLLLPANYDYLFDRHLITFAHNGEIRFRSGKGFGRLYTLMGVRGDARLKFVTAETKEFLRQHQRQVELGSRKPT